MEMQCAPDSTEKVFMGTRGDHQGIGPNKAFLAITGLINSTWMQRTFLHPGQEDEPLQLPRACESGVNGVHQEAHECLYEDLLKQIWTYETQLFIVGSNGAKRLA
jgi:hypothetical protein